MRGGLTCRSVTWKKRVALLLAVDDLEKRRVRFSKEPAGFPPSPTRGEGDMRGGVGCTSAFQPLPLCDGGGWVGVYAWWG